MSSLSACSSRTDGLPQAAIAPEGDGFVTVMYGPSGVGKTAMLRALGESVYSIWCELPTMQGARVGPAGSAQQLRLLCIEMPELGRAEQSVSLYLFSKMIVLAQLFATGHVSSPKEWLHAQLWL